MDRPLPGKAQNFIDGLDVLRSYVGGTTQLVPKGSTIHVVNVDWKDLTEAQQDSLYKKGWTRYGMIDSGYLIWVAEG